MSWRFVYGIVAILVLTAGYACWCRAPLIWDGAYQFNQVLAAQHPYVYLTRFHTFFLWWPTVWASRCTSNVVLLQSVYGLPFLLAPAAALLLSWWMVKDAVPRLIIWAVFGVAAATLPGQIFVINDSIFQQHLFWPLFLGMFVPLTWPKRISLGVLAIFQFVHPLGIVLFFGAATALSLVAVVDPPQSRQWLFRAGAMAALGALALAKVQITNHIPRWHDVYAEQEATWAQAHAYWAVAVRGNPIRGLRFMWMSAALVFFQPLLVRRSARLGGAAKHLSLLCVVIGAAFWIRWAHSPVDSWGGAICYRRWIGPLTLPFFALASAEACMAAWRQRAGGALDNPTNASATTSARGPVGVLVALTFSLVLGMQCWSWDRLTNRLMAVVRTFPATIVPASDPSLQWMAHTPLNHWGTADYVSAMQGKTPTKIFMDSNPDNFKRLVDEMTAPRGPGGWFDFRPALQQMRSEGWRMPHADSTIPGEPSPAKQ